MKRKKRLLSLVGVFALLCAAAVAVSRYQQQQEQIKTSGQVILELDSTTVTALSWDLEEANFSFSNGDIWQYNEDEDFPVDQTALQELLAHFEPLSAAFAIEDVTDLSQYGLDDPMGTLTLTTESETYTIQLGDLSKMDDQRYVDMGDGKVYLIADDPAEFLPTELSDLAQKDSLPYLTELESMTMAGDVTAQVVRMEEQDLSYSEADVYFMEEKPLDTAKIDSYLSAVSALDCSEYSDYYATDEELESFGLLEPEQSITLNYLEDDETQSVTLHLGRDPEQLAESMKLAEEGKDAPEVPCYFRVGDSRMVYPLTTEEFDTLTDVSYNSLRHAQLFWGDFGTVSQMDVTLEDTAHTMTAQNDTWYFGEEEIDLTNLQTALEGLTSSVFTGEEPSKQLEISLTLTLEDEKHPTVTIDLYRYDGTHCLAVVDGTSTALVDRSDAMELVEAVQEIVLE